MRKISRCKKAQGTPFNIFTIMIMAFVAVVLFAGMIYEMGWISSIFHDIGVSNDARVNPNSPGYTNMTQASDNTFGQLNTSIQALRMVAIVYILGLAVVFMLTNALMRLNPIWFFAYMLICLLAVLFAPLISNAYLNLLQSNVFEGELNTFTASNWILLNLPTFTLIISVLGGIFLFVNLVRQGGDQNLMGN